MMTIIIMGHHICRLPQEEEDEETGEASLIPMTTTAMMTIMNTTAMTITIIEAAMKIRTTAMKTFKFKVEDEGVEEPVEILCLGDEVQLQLEEEEVSPSVEAQDPAEGHVAPEEEFSKEAAWYVRVRESGQARPFNKLLPLIINTDFCIVYYFFLSNC